MNASEIWKDFLWKEYFSGTTIYLSGSNLQPHNNVLPVSKRLTVCVFSDSKTYYSLTSVCQQVRTGIAAIFGPESTISGAHVQSICERLELPRVVTSWGYKDEDESRDPFSISLYPEYETLSRAYRDMVEHLGWKSFTVLYKKDDGESVTYLCKWIVNVTIDC